MKRIQVVCTYDSQTTIIDSIREMIRLANDGGYTAKEDINGVVVLVNGDSNADLIFRDCKRAHSDYIDNEVGPYPKAELSVEDTNSDKFIEEKKEELRVKRGERYKVIEQKEKEELMKEFEDFPKMERDEEEWQKCIDTQKGNLASFEYAERWARLMQKEMSDGKLSKDAVDTCSYKADVLGTSISIGIAINILAKCWKHWDELRRCLNDKGMQIGTEGDESNETGGVLNPAIIRFVV